MVCPRALRQRFGRSLAKKALDGRPLGLNIGQLELGGARPGDDDQVDSRGHQAGPETKALPA